VSTPPETLPRFYSTADGATQRQLAAALLQLDAKVEHVDIPSRRTRLAEPDIV
jgi:glutamate racemase